MPKLLTALRATGLINEMEGRVQSWVADRAEVSHAHFHDVLHGKKAISQEKAERIAVVLKRPVEELFEVLR